MWVVHSEGETLLTGYEKKPTKQEQLAVYAYGKNTEILKDLIQEAIDFSVEKDTNLTNIY